MTEPMDNNLFFHKELNHQELSDKQLYRLLKNNEICWAGNRRLKIYGTLSCASGKRMKKKTECFFFIRMPLRHWGIDRVVTAYVIYIGYIRPRYLKRIATRVLIEL